MLDSWKQVTLQQGIQTLTNTARRRKYDDRNESWLFYTIVVIH